jgi:hypothetical protein
VSEFDDSNLSSEIGRLAGDSPEAGAAYAAVTTRVRRARRRRAAAWSGGAMAAVAVIAVAASFGGGESRLENVPATQPDVVVEDSTDWSVPSSTETSLLPASVSTTSAPDTSATVVPPAATTPLVPSTSSPSSPPSTSAPRPPATSTAPLPTQPPSTQPPSPPVTQSFSCVGGSATVRLQNGVLAIVGTVPNSGWLVAEIGGEGSEVEVRFEQGSVESRLKVDLVNGSMVPICEESSND